MFFDIGHLFGPYVSPWILRAVGGVCPTPCLLFPETPRVFPPRRRMYSVRRGTEYGVPGSSVPNVGGGVRFRDRHQHAPHCSLPVCASGHGDVNASPCNHPRLSIGFPTQTSLFRTRCAFDLCGCSVHSRPPPPRLAYSDPVVQIGGRKRRRKAP